VSVLYFGDVVQTRLGGFGVSLDKIKKNPAQITRTIKATLRGVRFIRDNRPETLAIMRDYLHVSAEGAAKVHDFAMRSLNVDGSVAKATLDSEIRLAREQLKINDEITEDRLMDWRFLKGPPWLRSSISRSVRMMCKRPQPFIGRPSASRKWALARAEFISLMVI
jgi:ABC-type nitrate/sulfonate/bicarbonate transport system substrate-binding protein